MDVDYPRVALAGFATVVVVAVLVAASTSGAAFGAYNPSWDGTATFRSMADDTDAEGRLARSASVYRTVPPKGTLAVVLSPESAYESDESAAVRRFVRRGGTLLVAADVGPHGDRLLDAIGARARFDGAPLRDERYHGSTPAFPVATPVAEHPYTAGVDGVTLNHGTAIALSGTNGTVTVENGTVAGETGPTAGAEGTDVTVLLASSRYAYLDRNGDGALDEAETLGRSPVATVEPVGEGRVVAVSDPSVFVNAMLDRSDNRAFARNFYERHDRVVVDVSHAGRVPPVRAGVLALRESPPVQAVVGVLCLGLIGGWRILLAGFGSVRRRQGRGEGPSVSLERREVVAGIRERHPEWDEAAIERVMEAIMTGRSEGEDND